MRITFVNQKGGVGKTTVALLVAGVMRRSKFDVSLDDRDPQGSARFAVGMVEVPLFDPDHPTQYVVTDTPGHLDMEGDAGGRLRELLASSDRLVLVTEKTLASVHGSAPMAKLIVGTKRPDAKAYVLFNKVRAGTGTGQRSGPEIAAKLGLPALTVELPLSAALESGFETGLAKVTGPRRTELLELAMEVLG